MTPDQYLVESSRTAAAPKIHSELVSDYAFIAEAWKAKRVIDDLDRMKKALFYGKQPPLELTPEDEGDHLTPIVNINMLHAIIGIVTEAGELLEMLIDKKVSEIPHKFTDECGDLLWYIAMGIRETGSTFEEVMDKNINKLRVRFPDKFDGQLAIHKNDDAESLVFQS